MITAITRLVSAAASTNATSAKAAPAQVHSVVGYNAAAALRYLKLYDKASAPTVGTDTPFMTIAYRKYLSDLTKRVSKALRGMREEGHVRSAQDRKGNLLWERRGT
jgi:hypothetical protein